MCCGKHLNLARCRGSTSNAGNQWKYIYLRGILPNIPHLWTLLGCQFHVKGIAQVSDFPPILSQSNGGISTKGICWSNFVLRFWMDLFCSFINYLLLCTGGGVQGIMKMLPVVDCPLGYVCCVTMMRSRVTQYSLFFYPNTLYWIHIYSHLYHLYIVLIDSTRKQNHRDPDSNDNYASIIKVWSTSKLCHVFILKLAKHFCLLWNAILLLTI